MNLKETITTIKLSKSFLLKINNRNRGFFMHFIQKKKAVDYGYFNHQVVEKHNKHQTTGWSFSGNLSGPSDFDLSFTEIAWRKF